MNQPTFADLDYDEQEAKDSPGKFLDAWMDCPWEERAPTAHPKAGRWSAALRQLSVMLRIRCVQLSPTLSDSGWSDILYEVESVRRFVGLSTAVKSRCRTRRRR